MNAQRSHADKQDRGAPGTAALATLPLAIPAVILFLPTFVVQTLLEAPSASADHRRGDDARKRAVLDEAADAYLLALARGDRLAAEPLAEVWLEQGKEKDAIRARQLLLCTGANLGDSRWQQIESWLASKGEAPPRCADPSREPMPVSWED